MSSTNQKRRFLLDGLELEDFECDTLTSNFGSVVIRQLASTEKDNQVPEAKSVLEITARSDQLDYLASRIVTCFRLADEGGIGYNREFVSNIPTFIKEYGLPYRPPKGKEDTYKVSRAKLVEIKKLFSYIGDIVANQENEEDSLLRLALSRFNRSYDDANEDDILIDLMICFETLFILNRHDRSKGNLIADRVPKFLKKESGITYTSTSRELKDAYDIRSCVMHEGMRYNYVINHHYCIGDSWNFLLGVRFYARESLLACIKWLTNNKPRTLRDMKNSVIKYL